jgi:hypothetical protein
MSTTTSVDATAEMQAYYGAEAGLQQSLNALRGNFSPINGVPAGTRLTFRNAITLDKTNASTDPATVPRLSGWLQYNYTSTGAAFPDRVKVSPTDNSYNPLTGVAFKVEVSDPDNTCDVCGDPPRLVIQSIGYGPKGATKRLEMVVHRNYFNFAPPAAITMAGGTTMTFNMGNSNAAGYTGNDIHTPPLAGIPAVAVTSGSNQTTAQATIDYLNAQGGGTQVTPSTAELLTSSTTPDFLKSADAARAFLATAADIAQGDGRYFGTQAEVTGGLGTSTAPLTTFIDNYGGAAVSLGAGYQGCGLLIVTGELITSGTTDFEGMILVLGSGTFNRNGNGNGHIDGGIIVSRFDRYGTGAFGAPTFSVNGAGNSDVRYNSDAIRKAFDSAGVFVAGIHEY